MILHKKYLERFPAQMAPSWTTELGTAGRRHNNKPESHNSHWTTKGAVSTPTTTDPEERVSSRFIDGRNSEGESGDKGGQGRAALFHALNPSETSWPRVREWIFLSESLKGCYLIRERAGEVSTVPPGQSKFHPRQPNQLLLKHSPRRLLSHLYNATAPRSRGPNSLKLTVVLCFSSGRRRQYGPSGGGQFLRVTECKRPPLRY